VIHSAHIATYGERAVDVFYLTGADGRKLVGEEIDELRSALLEASRDPELQELAQDVAPEKVLDKMDETERWIGASAE